MSDIRRRAEIALIKTALSIVSPLDTLLATCSRWLSDGRKEKDTQLGVAVYRAFMQEMTKLKLQKLVQMYKLRGARDNLVALVRENRQLKDRLQMYIYEEDAAQVNRDSLLELHAEKSALVQENLRLIAELSSTELLLESMEHEIETPPQKKRRDASTDSDVYNNECCPLGEGGTVQVFSSFSTESIDSTYYSKHQIVVHVSSRIPISVDRQ